MNFFVRELSHYKRLNPSARNLLVSTIAYNIASPLLGLFANAFIWRQTETMAIVAFFNAAWIIGVTFAFVANGYLLRAISVARLFAGGLFLQSLANLVLFAIDAITVFHALSVGTFLGFMAGIYWSNRNLLTLQVTDSQERDYFCSLESSLAMLFASVSPALFGWFLQLGEYTGLFDVTMRYQVLMTVVLSIQAIGSIGILRSDFRDTQPKRVFLEKPTQFWKQARIFMFLKGSADGSALFFPALMVLYLVGREGALGAVQSFSVIFTSAVLYCVARRMTTEKRYSILVYAISIVTLGAAAIAVIYSTTAAIVYVLCQTLGVQLLWAAANPIMLDAISKDASEEYEQYDYIVDREIYLNIGRLSGIALFLGLVQLVGEETSLRVTPLLLAGLLSCLLISAATLTGRKNTITVSGQR